MSFGYMWDNENNKQWYITISYSGGWNSHHYWEFRRMKNEIYRQNSNIQLLNFSFKLGSYCIVLCCKVHMIDINMRYIYIWYIDIYMIFIYTYIYIYIYISYIYIIYTLQQKTIQYDLNLKEKLKSWIFEFCL